MAKPGGRLRKLVLLLVVLGAAVVAIPFLPLSPLKSAAELRLSAMLGRRVTIDSARLNLLGGPHLTLTGMTAQEDKDFGGGVFLKADEVRAGFDILQYLRTRQILIDSITLKSPQIALVKNTDGVWSWTTLGKQLPEQPVVSRLVTQAIARLTILSPVSSAEISSSGLRSLNIESASVRVVDESPQAPSEILYKNIYLSASLTPYPAGDPRGSSQAKGEVNAKSNEAEDADLLQATLPFDLTIDGRNASELGVSGSIGPGPIETKNLRMSEFAINGKIEAEKAAQLTGNGRMSASDLFIGTFNLSEQVAHALKVDQIGDMSPGTLVTSLETDFQFSKGSFNTRGLRIQQLDGLGDATAESGNFKIESALEVDYHANIMLTSDATSRIKAIGPMVGLLATILETNNRLSVPINIRGDVRKPDIAVDVNRVF
jgi:uncharacterized protein involved in outer membrane biogenesis